MNVWITDVNEKQNIWDLYKTVPPPLGFDPTPHYRTIEHKYFGLLQFTPWRVELAELAVRGALMLPTPVNFTPMFLVISVNHRF